jgi:hypothetical protein
MTRITKRRPGKGWWLSAALGPHKSKDLAIAIAVTPYNLELRLARTRQVYRFPIAKLFMIAAEAEARAQAKARAEAKAKARAERNGQQFVSKRRRTSPTKLLFPDELV